MGTTFNNVTDLAAGELADAITDVQDAFDLAAGDGALFPAAPFIATIGQPGLDGAYGAGKEDVVVGGRAGDALSSVTRGAGAQAWPAGTPVRVNWNSALYNVLVSLLGRLEWFLGQMVGGADGVYVYPAVLTDSLKVVATTPASMAVTVKAGAAIEGGIPNRLAADTDTDAMVAPVGAARIDRVYFDVATGGIGVVAGVEGGGAPSVPAGTTLLARIAHTVGEGSVETAAITDERTFINA